MFDTEIRIRQATINDSAKLAEVGAITFYDTFHMFHSAEDMQKYISGTYNEDKVKGNLQNPSIMYYLAEQDGKAVGYLKLLLNVEIEQMKGERVMELEKIYVRKEWLGAGVGKRLMQQAIAAAVQEKCDWLFLGVWQDNHRALDFYKKFGWAICGNRQFTLGDTICDDYLLKLKLG